MLTKLELGSGRLLTPGYLHQDISKELPSIDFVCYPWEIPLGQNSLSEIIAVGVMEHLRWEEFDKTLKHIHYLLMKDGIFLFDLPDMIIWSEYLYNMTHGQSHKNPFPDQHIWGSIYGRQRWIGDEHKSGWTKEMILKKINNIRYIFLDKNFKSLISFTNKLKL
jgi:predicted SAM-dependent methyltransferase